MTRPVAFYARRRPGIAGKRLLHTPLRIQLVTSFIPRNYQDPLLVIVEYTLNMKNNETLY